MTLSFSIKSEYHPRGDQPQAIATLTENIKKGKVFQTLLGATGTGKSLDFKEQIILIDEKNIIHKTQIGEFIERHLNNPQEINGTQFQRIKGFRVLSFNNIDYQIEMKNVVEVSKHEEDVLYEITLDDNSRIRVTKDHNCFKIINCKLELCSTKELKIGDYLPCSNSILKPSQNSFNILNLLDFNPDFKLNIKSFIEKNLNSIERIKEVLKNEHFAYNWKLEQILKETKERGISIGNLKTLLNQLNLNLNDVYSDIKIITKGNDLLNPLIPVDNNFLIFTALYLSEGHCTDRYILISNSDPNLQNKCKEFFDKLNLNYNQRNQNDIQFNSILLSNFYKNLGKKAKEKQIINSFYNLSNNQLKVFLKTLFDGDGWVEKSAVCYLSASQQLIFDIKNLLLRFDIVSRISKKKKKYKTTSGNYKEGIYFQLNISGQDNLRKFKENISFSLTYKRKRLNSILGKKENTNVEIIPYCSSYIKELRSKLNLSQKQLADRIGCVRQEISHIENNKRFPSKNLFRKIISLENNSVRLKNLLNFNFRKIIDIKKVKSTNGFVYDIAVEDNENFCAGYGNIFVHNTFTIANIIQSIQKPTLIMAPNKTLAAQLYNELKELFPENAVHYFVSYYDYYQPEAYLPITAQYIEKDFSVNEEIERLRLAATHAIRTRNDVIIVATVSCIYGIGSPEEWEKVSINLNVGDVIKRGEILKGLIRMNYERKDVDFRPGIVRVRGDIIDIFPAYLDTAIRVSLFGDEIESIQEIHPISNQVLNNLPNCRIFPATHFIIPEENKIKALESIELELEERIKYFLDKKRYPEAEWIERRVKFDLEMMREMGWCKGIENYSRHLDGRPPGTPPMCLIDYFPDNFLIVVDESHVTIPQIHGMIGGDRSRKKNLVDYGWRLPSAYDNRPLTFEEWESKIEYIIFMSATPGDWELERSGGISAEQIIRPTGLVDPQVEIRPAKNQIDDLLNELRNVIKSNGRALITTLTKRMSEDIAEYYSELGIKIAYLHSEVDTVERFDILRQLRDGTFDAVVGINLLREGLDLPEVKLVAILDADKLGFLRDTRSLIQTIGRASRNVEGRAILYAEKMTPAMKSAIDETNRRRNKQIVYNKEHNITPQTIKKNILESLSEEHEIREKEVKRLKQHVQTKIEELEQEGDIEILIQYLENKMFMAAKELRFEDAAYLRDKIKERKEDYFQS